MRIGDGTLFVCSDFKDVREASNSFSIFSLTQGEVYMYSRGVPGFMSEHGVKANSPRLCGAALVTWSALTQAQQQAEKSMCILMSDCSKFTSDSA